MKTSAHTIRTTRRIPLLKWKEDEAITLQLLPIPTIPVPNRYPHSGGLDLWTLRNAQRRLMISRSAH